MMLYKLNKLDASSFHHSTLNTVTPLSLSLFVSASFEMLTEPKRTNLNPWTLIFL